MNYYPLAAGNEWHYRQKDGNTYVNKITTVNGGEFNFHNSAANTSSIIKADNSWFVTDAMEPGNFQQWVSNDLKAGDTWEVKFKANGLDSILVMTVMETGMTKVVEGREYENIIMIEGESKIVINGNLMALNFFTQYYYSDGVGLVLTTSAAGDVHALTSYTLH